MPENCEIKHIEICKTRKGDRAIKIVLTKDNETNPKKKWVREFIGCNAPDFVIERWWNLLGVNRGWNSFISEDAFEFIGLKVTAELEDSEYGEKVKKVSKRENTTINEQPPPPPTPTPTRISDSEIPF